MQQRQPRLGDIVDDYCPRERRVTNHAVVAMVGDEVKQTRCTTCEAEHEYKQARIPPQRKKKEAEGALFQQVLAGMPRKVAAVNPPESEGPIDSVDPNPEPLTASPEEEPTPQADEPVERELELAVHRPLIRATLPRLTDDPPQRREPEFTIRDPQLTRPGRFGKNGFRGPRPGGQGQGQGHGHGHGFGTNGNRTAGGKRHGGGGNRPGGGRPGQAAQGNRPPRAGGHGHNRGGKKSPR